MQRRSIHANNKIKKNSVIKKKDLIVLRPYLKNSFHPYELNKVVGKKAKKNFAKGEIVLWKKIK